MKNLDLELSKEVENGSFIGLNGETCQAPPLLSLGREIQTISEMICCIFTFFEKFRMNEIQK